MVENDSERRRFDWRPLLYFAAITIVISAIVTLAESDGILYFVGVFPIVSLTLFVLLLRAATKNRMRRSAVILSMLAIYWLLSLALLTNYSAIRDVTRWSLRSHRYKSELLAQPASKGGELRHIEWDGWGFPGAGDTTVYLVFDPSDSLAVAAKNHHPGKFNGIPCTVPRVSRLENNWYAVLFYTDERWGRPHWDCGMND